MQIRYIIGLAAAALALVACSKPGAGAADPAAAGSATPTLLDLGPAGDADKGKAVYDRVCVACHQADGSGNGGMLAANFLKDKTRLAKPDSALFKSIKDGVQGKIGVMPAQAGALKDDEIKNVIAYLRSRFGG